ncbi:helix-turn-helix domain-containing protein [Halorhabdus amylolytica]|uniref:helix-turn-helix domain-containing protein n=1 Tax=Halorhabdus amylolytica TaxID=2559573 RepID=UPI00145A4955|nr:helix-turn-helix domain-containing protein [Halorhabdus amylolytica]
MIACCRFDAEVLETTFAEHPDLSLEVEGLHAGESIPFRLVFWARGAPAADLDVSLAADPTVEDVRRLATTDDAVLYRSMHPGDLPAVSIYNAAIEHDALLLAAINEGDGWNVRFRIPDRDALSTLCERCQDLGIGVDVTSIHDRDDATCYGFGLTPSQREILTLAWERGYFSVPRETTLASLADELDISQQAASERLRRGLWVLVSNTVCECDVDGNTDMA